MYHKNQPSSFWHKTREALRDLRIEPIYVEQKTDDSVVEGWRLAYRQQEKRANVAELRLKKLDELANTILDYNVNPQYAEKMKIILHMTEEELYTEHGDSRHD